MKRFYNEHPYWSSLLIAALSILLMIVLLQFFLSAFTRHGQANPVPDFVGLNIAEAKELADKHSLVLEVTDSVNITTRPLGTV
ncbi:MAG: PASTA domain-containing protein, partial [Bacteroidales bacterium]|nr:PASTA domain-containing protein [Bacteroidales bacterium]